jgi:hypothetical protein
MFGGWRQIDINNHCLPGLRTMNVLAATILSNTFSGGAKCLLDNSSHTIYLPDILGRSGCCIGGLVL